MKEHPSGDYQLEELILMEIEGVIEEFQFEVLQERLRNDPDALKLYVELMSLYSALSQPGEVALSEDKDQSPVNFTQGYQQRRCGHVAFCHRRS